MPRNDTEGLAKNIIIPDQGKKLLGMTLIVVVVVVILVLFGKQIFAWIRSAFAGMLDGVGLGGDQVTQKITIVRYSLATMRKIEIHLARSLPTCIPIIPTPLQ